VIPPVESFNGRVRDELLAVEEFSCLAEAGVVIGDLRLHPGYEYREAGISRMRAGVGGRERSLSASSFEPAAPSNVRRFRSVS
jgi:hypothetical protein